ncbi:hypothetical protein GCM10012275_01940 [Longimycelium tulufanense]|uniref:Uncharacterized protein n=1 Tax=Longimycelium tulufanense TaxID=907463 RepID=A0A8J3FS68_9PSEU|nr:hypothetical protein GCM10012275_01940 [Longimycelium tulufanense]
MLLMGWTEVGHGLLQAIGDIGRTPIVNTDGVPAQDRRVEQPPGGADYWGAVPASDRPADDQSTTDINACRTGEDQYLELARQADAEHWERYRRPILGRDLAETASGRCSTLPGSWSQYYAPNGRPGRRSR